MKKKQQQHNQQHARQEVEIRVDKVEKNEICCNLIVRNAV